MLLNKASRFYAEFTRRPGAKSRPGRQTLVAEMCGIVVIRAHRGRRETASAAPQPAYHLRVMLASGLSGCAVKLERSGVEARARFLRVPGETDQYFVSSMFPNCSLDVSELLPNCSLTVSFMFPNCFLTAIGY